MRVKKSELVFVALITLILTAGDLFGLPLGLLPQIHIADVEPVYLTLMANQWLLIGLALMALRFLCPTLKLGLKKDGFAAGIKKYALSGVSILAVLSLTFWLGWRGSYDYSPTVTKVVIEGFAYALGVGFIEELYIRGLLLNFIEAICKNKKNKTVIAIIASSLIFGLGHIPGMLDQNLPVIACRLVWTTTLGIYLGVAYKKSNNLFVPIVLHAVINFSAVAACFTTVTAIPLSVSVTAAIVCLAAGMWSLFDFRGKDRLLSEG
jgi:membrane protease YdiL (CAAX protease family)